MKKFIESARENTHLQFVDPVTDQIYRLDDLKLFTPLLQAPQKSLVFWYGDNTITAVTGLFSAFDSPHAIALFSPNLDPALKNKLEQEYQPEFIFDKKRESFEGYSLIHSLGCFGLYRLNAREQTSIHPQLKLLLSTSGSTGSPKLVKLTEENILSNAASILAYLPIQPSDICPLNLPLYYSYGFSVFTTNSIKGGKLLCSNKDIMTKEYWLDFEKYGCTSMAGVPFVYEMLNRTGFTKKHYADLRYLTQAGGKLSPQLVETFREHARNHHYLFFVMYGQTEATARMAYLPPEKLGTKPGSIGIPIPGGSFRIEPGSQELVYKGPNVFKGYALSRNDLQQIEEMAELHTGDTAVVDQDGFYFIKGRLKRFTKLFGNRINLDEVEQLLLHQFRGTSFGCLGYNDKYLLVYQQEPAVVPGADILTFIQQKLGIHPSAVKTLSIAKWPLTANGKTDYTALSATYAIE